MLELVAAPILVGVVLAYLTVRFFSSSSGHPLSPSAAASGTSKMPFTVAVTGQSAFACVAGWVMPQPPSGVPLPPSNLDDLNAWMAAHDGVVADYGAVQLTIQGTTAAQVTLTSLQVQVVNRAPALAGTHVYQQCGGPGAVRELQVDLDHNPPIYKPINRPDLLGQGGPAWRTTPIVFPYKVSISDAETFLVLASTLHCDCTWRIKLDWASQGQTGTMVIDDHGTPFRTSGSTNAGAQCIVGTRWDCGPLQPFPAYTP